MFHKITSLATLPDFVLLVGFQDGEYKQFDLKPYIEKYPPFRSLKDINGLYEQAKIDVGGFGIVWNDDLDVSAEGIYEKGVPCSEPNDIEEYKQKLKFYRELLNLALQEPKKAQPTRNYLRF